MKISKRIGAVVMGLAVCASTGFAEDDTTMTADSAETARPTTLLKYNSIQPEGKTLPEKVLRVRTSFLSTKDNGKLYDKDGKDTDLPLEISGSGAAFVAEYGLNDKTSLQLLVPYTMSQKGEIKNLDKNALIDGAVTKIAQSFVSNKLACGDLSGCKAYVNSNAAAPADIPLGGGASIPKGTPMLTAITSAVNTQFDGETGVGDVELGILYNLYNENHLSFSFGGGFRFATGKFTDVDGQPTSRGTTDLGLRLNLDYAPVDFLLLSWQNQTEFMLAKGKKKVGEKEYDFEREGALNKGFIQVAFAAGKIHQSLKSISVYSQYVYKVDGQERVDGNALSARAENYSMLYGFGVSGLDYGVPVSLNIDSYETMSAKNTFGSKNVLVNLKGYYKF